MFQRLEDLELDLDRARVHDLRDRKPESIRTTLTMTPPLVIVPLDSADTCRTLVALLNELECDNYRRLLVVSGTSRLDPQPLSSSEDVPREIPPGSGVLLERRSGRSVPPTPRPGLSEDRLEPGEIPTITHFGLRLIDLGLLRTWGQQVVWEIGAGSGSITIESARLNPSNRYYPVEHDPETFQALRRNVRACEVYNVIPVQGWATESLPELPDPDRVFIGGTCGELDGILERVHQRLKAEGRVVANYRALENVERTRNFFRDHGYEVSMLQSSFHPGGTIGSDYACWEPGPILQALWADRP